MTIISAPAETPAPATRRRWGRTALTVLIWLLIVPTLLWAIVRVTGWERGPLVQLLAYTPYVAAWSVLPAVLALTTQRWAAAVAGLVAAVALLVAVVPR